jgi:DNA-binding transcriptional regulator GbsR (MarR family)
MPEDPISQEMARILNEKLQRVIDKQTEHTIALANHTASLDRLEKGQEELREMLRQLLSRGETDNG